MTNALNTLLLGAVAMASLVAAMFFLRFWLQTKDYLFVLFATAFGVDAVTRFILGLGQISDEQEPFFYLARLITFGLIIIAIANKNRPNAR
jgi:uncharacterized membrane protein HdeD (DUF308 family)